MFSLNSLDEQRKKLEHSRIDDFVDKGHYFISSGLLLFFAVLIGGSQIYGDPINCLVPAEYPGGWNNYVNSYCFVTSTYTINGSAETMAWDERSDMPNEQKTIIDYYQWVPYMLALQAVLSFAPHFIWTVYQATQTDISFQHVIKDCVASRDMTVKNKDEKLDALVDGLVKTYEFRRIKDNSKGLGTAGMAVYIGSKCLNVIIVITQLAILNRFLGGVNFSWSLETLKGAMDSADWKYTGYFPRVSFCTFKQGVLAGSQLRTVQCVLMMNMINEKLFMVLFIWFSLLLVATAANLIQIVVFYITARVSTAGRFLKISDCTPLEHRFFAIQHLGYDGLLLLRFIEINAGFITASTVATKLYKVLRDKFNRRNANVIENNSKPAVTSPESSNARKNREETSLLPPDVLSAYC